MYLNLNFIMERHYIDKHVTIDFCRWRMYACFEILDK